MENNNVIMDEVRPRKWLLVILIIIALVIVVVLANKVITDRNNRIQKEEEVKEEIFDNITNEYDKQKEQSEIKIFNSKFEFYTGTKHGGAVSMLLDNVIRSNKKEKEHIINVIYGDVVTSDENEIITIKRSLDDFTDYEVLVDYDEKGYVNQIKIMD